MSGHIPTIEGVETTPTATAAEAAAITAAVESYIRERQAAAAPGKAEEGWDGERFAFAGRLDALGGEPARVPRNGPTDRWTAAGRTDRYER